MKKLLAALLVMGTLVPAHAGVLYKSVGPNGTIMFSDVRPPGDARIVEQRAIPSYGGAANDSSNDGAPITLIAASPLQLIDSDEAVQRANAKVDQAEHELALARRNTWSPHDGLRLAATRATLSDAQRVEFYKRNLRAARQYMIELIRERQTPQGAGRVLVSANY